METTTELNVRETHLSKSSIEALRSQMESLTAHVEFDTRKADREQANLDVCRARIAEDRQVLKEIQADLDAAGA